jgi:hypothetical protein
MNTTAEAVTLTFPRSVVGDVISLSAKLLDRMHELLERNTDGNLSPVEREELKTLVQMAEFSQILSTALTAQARP